MSKRDIVHCSRILPRQLQDMFTFVIKLYDQIMIDVPKVSPQATDVIFSDGPSSEFKNKFTMKLLAELAKKVNGTISRKYSATISWKSFRRKD